MAIVVLLILAAVWAVVLVPPLLRARTERSGDSIDDFNHRLGVLQRTNGAEVVAPTPAPVTTLPLIGTGARRARPRRPAPVPSSAAKRRRDVTTVLAGAVAATLLLATVADSTALWALQVATDVLLVAYLALVAWFRSLHADHDRTVRYLPRHAPPELVLRRTASS